MGFQVVRGSGNVRRNFLAVERIVGGLRTPYGPKVKPWEVKQTFQGKWHSRFHGKSKDSNIVAVRGFMVAPPCNPIIKVPNEKKTSAHISASWIGSRLIPQGAKPYLHLIRADKQVGTLLLMWPCFWSVSLASQPHTFPDPLLLSQFAVGAIIMRGAGCIINDIWDKDFDRHVERTKHRPIANGDISVTQALGFLGVNLLGGLGVLLQFNHASILLGFLSMPLVVAYPLMKRFTNWPQLVLGFTFNWGALVGYLSVTNNIEDTLHCAVPLYLAGVCWTLVYDTLYGYQDRKDDAKIGVKSTSLYLGDKPQLPLTIISTGLLAGLLVTGVNSDLTMPYYIGVSSMWAHLLWQIWTANINDPSNLWTRFNSNKFSGGFLTAAIIAGHF